MKRLKYLLVIFIALLTLSACSSNKPDRDRLNEENPALLYKNATEKLQSGNYQSAITELEALDNRYPYGPYAQQVQLDLIYAYYKSGELALAISSIDRFLRLNPTHANVDYVLYIRGLTNMGLDSNMLHSFFGMSREDRDPQYAQAAFTDFSQLIRNYPKSIYLNDAKIRLKYLQNRLAGYDLAVAKFYTKREAYVAVINRVQQMLVNYPNTASTRQALPLMENAYRQLNLTAQADKTAELIRYNK